MDIEIERSPVVQKGKPTPVHVKLIDNAGSVKGFVSIVPCFRSTEEDNDQFRVEVWSLQTVLDKPVDIKVTI